MCNVFSGAKAPPKVRSSAPANSDPSSCRDFSNRRFLAHAPMGSARGLEGLGLPSGGPGRSALASDPGGRVVVAACLLHPKPGAAYCYVPNVLRMDRKDFDAGAISRPGFLANLR